MAFNKIEHIGIAVKDITASAILYQKLLGIDCYKTEIVESEGVKTAFFKLGDSKIELLGSLKPDTAIDRFVKKRGEGLHHIAFDVDDIYAEIIRLKKEGFVFVKDEPFKGADNKLVCFLHPKSTNGVLVELCQENKD